MARIKDRLIFENKKMEAVAQRKTNAELKLRAKEAQSHKLAQKAKRKKDHFKAVQEWAQTAASNRGSNVREDDEVFLRRMNGTGPSKKRQAADRKYGFGGKRGRFKKTDPSTLNDLSAFRKHGNFEGGRKSSGGSTKKRPGKRARQARRH
jgi:rRNA-processing protein EBP2